MKLRYSPLVCVALGLTLVMPGSPAGADDTVAPDVAVEFAAGKASTFGWTRFDGEKVGKFVYFLGYRDANNETDGSIWTYDIKKKKFADTGIDMPVAISNYTIAALTDDTGLGLYTFGGRDATGLTSTVVQVFYPATGDTAVLEDDPWPGTTPSECVSLPATGIAVSGNMAYALGGMSFGTSIPPCVDDVSKEVWRFNPTAAAGNKWKKQPSLKVARGYVTGAVVDGNRIFAIGGDLNEAGTLVAQMTVESWKVGAKKWNDTNYADLPIACDESQAFAFDSGPLSGTITVAGCGQWPAAVTDVVQYDVGDDSWSTVGALLEARRNHAGVNIGTAAAPKLLVAGGYAADGSTLMTTEIGTVGAGPFDGSGLSPAPAPVPGAIATVS